MTNDVIKLRLSQMDRVERLKLTLWEPQPPKPRDIPQRFLQWEIPKGVDEAVLNLALGMLWERAIRMVPVWKSHSIPYNASGVYMHFAWAPDRDHILIRDGSPAHFEIVILAHELGHAENCRQEAERFKLAMRQVDIWRVLKDNPTEPNLIVEEEVAANRRGRVHIEELIPELLPTYDLAMDISLDGLRRNGWM